MTAKLIHIRKNGKDYILGQNFVKGLEIVSTTHNEITEVKVVYEKLSSIGAEECIKYPTVIRMIWE